MSDLKLRRLHAHFRNGLIAFGDTRSFPESGSMSTCPRVAVANTLRPIGTSALRRTGRKTRYTEVIRPNDPASASFKSSFRARDNTDAIPPSCKWPPIEVSRRCPPGTLHPHWALSDATYRRKFEQDRGWFCATIRADGQRELLRPILDTPCYDT